MGERLHERNGCTYVSVNQSCNVPRHQQTERPSHHITSRRSSTHQAFCLSRERGEPVPYNIIAQARLAKLAKSGLAFSYLNSASNPERPSGWRPICRAGDGRCPNGQWPTIGAGGRLSCLGMMNVEGKPPRRGLEILPEAQIDYRSPLFSPQRERRRDISF